MSHDDDLSAWARQANTAAAPWTRLAARLLRKEGEPSGGQERENRHDTGGAVISALADALEARHRVGDLQERLEEQAEERSKTGFAPEDDTNVVFDFASFGLHTVKTFLELNARANRKLIEALRNAADARPPGAEEERSPREQPLDPIQLTYPSASQKTGVSNVVLGRFEVANRRGARLAMSFPDTLTFHSVTHDSDTHELKVRFVPRRVDMRPDSVEVVEIRLVDTELREMQRGHWICTVKPHQVSHGSAADLSCVLRVEAQEGVEIFEGTSLAGHLFDLGVPHDFSIAPMSLEAFLESLGDATGRKLTLKDVNTGTWAISLPPGPSMRVRMALEGVSPTLGAVTSFMVLDLEEIE